MSKVKVSCFALSLEGFGAGPDQTLENPMGRDGLRIQQWAFATRTMQAMFGQGGGATGVDDDFVVAGFANVGAWILGRNMFGPVRGPWPDESWKGWWGPNPPYHVPVFVLTHHAREPLVMEGGTTFHFVADGIESALAQARAAAAGKDVRIGGGAQTIREYLQAGLIDEMHLVLTPALLGTGEHLLAGIDLRALGFTCTRHAGTGAAMHVVLTKDAAAKG